MTVALPPPERLVPWLALLRDGETEIDRVPVASVTPAGGGGLRLVGEGSAFCGVATWSAVDGHAPHWDVTLELRFAGRDAVDAGVEIAIRLGPSGDPRWLIPGLFYGENRLAASRSRYPRWSPMDRPPDDPFVASGWTFRADRAATAAVAASAGGRVVVVATNAVTELGLSGIGFSGGGPGGGPAELRICAPYREEPVVYDGGDAPLSADLPTHRWEPGESVRLSFRVYAAAAGRAAWAPALRDLAAREAAAVAPRVDLVEAADLACDGLLRWHFDDSVDAIYETAAFDRDDAPPGRAAGDRRAMHVAWLSGAPVAAALLAHAARTGREDARHAGEAVIDAICANRAPCGTFWGQWSAERGWGKGWTPGDDALQARTIAEATLFTLRASSGDAGSRDTGSRDTGSRDTAWRDAASTNLRFIVERQRDDGALPAIWNGRTGDPASWDGSAGLAWVPALVEGGALLDDASLPAAAQRAGSYYAGFVDREFLYGAPEDVDLGPTSEDGYAAVMAYVALAEAAPTVGERNRWLDLARRSAEWMLTFRYSWDVPFPSASTLGRAGFRTRGLDLASPANQHLHTYGLICVPELVRLGVALEDPYLVGRAREHLAAARQVIVRADGEFGGRRGMTPERYYQTRYGGPIGEIGRLSHAWSLGLLLWACEAALTIPKLADAGTSTGAA
ncbi:MAG TPA: hypothetical protein VFV72_04260 [Candidatus Limnocylindrales bacterium]|nr:hypothetical protein [Candidatus Limnocylindrales bacterium]